MKARPHPTSLSQPGRDASTSLSQPGRDPSTSLSRRARSARSVRAADRKGGRGGGAPQSDEARGSVLVLVLIVLMVLVAMTLTLARKVKVEIAVAGAAADELKLRALVDSAVERAMAEVLLDELAGDSLAENWRDAEPIFRGVEQGAGRFWLMISEPDPGDGRELRYGLRDEASKLNVNTATREQLLLLPGITEDAVDGIIDWRDGDDDPGEFGTETTYYSALEVPYQSKNAPIESLDELLLIRGIDEQMLYGEDRNRNGLLDPGENDGDQSFPDDDADGFLDRGLIDYLTVFSSEPNGTYDDRAKLNWAQATTEDLQQRLTDAGMEQADLDQVLAAKGLGGGAGGSLGLFVANSTISEQGAAILWDEVSNSAEPSIPGRVNINTCPREVLEGLPGLELEDVEAIMSGRLEFDTDLSTPAWLLRVVERQKLSQLFDLVTTRSEQFTVHVVALLEGRPRFRRVEVVIDRTFVPVRIVSWRDVTGLGFPFPEERGERLP